MKYSKLLKMILIMMTTARQIQKMTVIMTKMIVMRLMRIMRRAVQISNVGKQELRMVRFKQVKTDTAVTSPLDHEK